MARQIHFLGSDNSCVAPFLLLNIMKVIKTVAGGNFHPWRGRIFFIFGQIFLRVLVIITIVATTTTKVA
jgi:hypothetical protein